MNKKKFTAKNAKISKFFYVTSAAALAILITPLASWKKRGTCTPDWEM
jgi:hypothetical protein